MLHGSAFSYKNKAILLLGLSGTGKSESVYQLSKDFKIITDDIICVENKNKNIVCKSGFEFLSVQDDDSNLQLHDKRNRSLVFLNESQTELNDLKIEQIFFLHWGDINSIETMIDSNAFKNLMANTFRPISSEMCVKSERHFLETQLSFLNSVKKYSFYRKKGDAKQSIKYLIEFLESDD